MESVTPSIMAKTRSVTEDSDPCSYLQKEDDLCTLIDMAKGDSASSSTPSSKERVSMERFLSKLIQKKLKEANSKQEIIDFMIHMMATDIPDADTEKYVEKLLRAKNES